MNKTSDSSYPQLLSYAAETTGIILWVICYAAIVTEPLQKNTLAILISLIHSPLLSVHPVTLLSEYSLPADHFLTPPTAGPEHHHLLPY